MDVLRITDWETHFENNRTRELKNLDWVPVPNKMDGDGYTELVEHENGAAHYGAWHAILKIASRCYPRGVLLRDGSAASEESRTTLRYGRTLLREGAKPHSAHSLARISRLPLSVFEEAIPRLISIGWLERISLQTSEITQMSQEGAGKSQDGAGKRLRKGREGKGIEGKGKSDASASRVSDSPFAVLKSYFTSEWQKRHSDTEYNFNGPKDGAATGRIIKACHDDLDLARRVVDAYLADSDPFNVKHGHGIAHLSSRLNYYIPKAKGGGRSAVEAKLTIDDILQDYNPPTEAIAAAAAEIRRELEAAKGGDK